MLFRMVVAFLTLQVILVPAALESQVPSDVNPLPNGVFVTGRISDQVNGRALSSARVVFAEPGEDGAVVWEGMSRSTGQFEVDRLRLGVYELRIELLSYTSVSQVVDLSERATVDFQIALAPAALALEPIVATAIRRTRLEMGGFWERRQSGLGYTLTREEIEQRNPNRVSDLFYGIPGARVVQPRRFGQSTQVFLRNNCVPQLVVDGAPFSMPIPIDHVLSVMELEAVEVYHGASTPVRFSNFTCGTIMAWTREPSSMEGAPFSWKRLLAASSLVTLGVLITR